MVLGPGLNIFSESRFPSAEFKLSHYLAAHSLPKPRQLRYHKSQMRRALSILLVLFFALGPLAVTLTAEDDTSLPACCRRHGTHHCAMQMAVAASADSGKTSVRSPSTCPRFPHSTALTRTNPQAFVASSVNLPVLLAQPHSAPAGRAAARLSQIRTRSGRAPPSASLA